MITTLSIFISPSLYHYHKFFNILKGCKDFQWTVECKTAFEVEELYVITLFVKLKPEEVLQLYLAFSTMSINSVLIKIKGKK